MRYKAKTDTNQDSIVKALRKCGCSVQILAQVGAGCPDLLVARHGFNYLLEVKGDKGKLTDDQVVWHREWRGQVAVVRSANEAVALINRED
jgi:hypothetical protein